MFTVFDSADQQNRRPEKPKGLFAQKSTCTGEAGITILVSWTVVPGATSYHVSRLANGQPDGGVITVTKNSYKHLGAVAGTTYTYLVTAVNSAGESDAAQVTVTATAQTTEPYEIPAGKTAVICIRNSYLNPDADKRGWEVFGLNHTDEYGDPAFGSIAYSLKDAAGHTYVKKDGWNVVPNDHFQEIPLASLTITVPSGTKPGPYHATYHGPTGDQEYEAEFFVTDNTEEGDPDTRDGLTMAEVVPPGWAEDAMPLDAGGATDAGPSAATAINLASGVALNSPGPDIAAFNPVGPSAVFARTYRSSLAGINYSSVGLSAGWTHNYDIAVAQDITQTWGPVVLRYANNAREVLTPVIGTDGKPTGAFHVPADAPYLVDGTPDPVNGNWKRITIYFTDGSRWEFNGFINFANPDGIQVYYLAGILSPLGQYLLLSYTQATVGENTVLRLSNVINSNGSKLLTLNYDSERDGGGVLKSAVDSQNRRVTYSSEDGVTLSGVSQFNSTLPAWKYEYRWIAHRPFLSRVGVLDPSGANALVYQNIAYNQTTARAQSLTDANGNVRSYTYGSGSTVVQAAGDTWTQNFDALQTDTGTMDSQNHSTVITRSGYRVAGVINPNNQTSQIDYDPSRPFNPTVITDSRGKTTTFGYNYSPNPMGRVNQIADGLGAPTQITYYPNGLVQTTTASKPGTTDGSTVSVSFTYTAMGDVQTITMPAPSDSGTVTYTYNYESDPQYGITRSEVLGAPLTVTDPLGHVSHFRYNADGQVTAVIDALGNQADFVYDYQGRLEFAYNPATGQTGSGRSFTRYIYNASGGILQTELRNESGGLVRYVQPVDGHEGEGLTTEGSVQPGVAVTYDGHYRVQNLNYKKSDGTGAATTAHAFDPVGNLTSLTYPGGDTVNYTEYDPAGNLKKFTDGRGKKTRFNLALDDSRLQGVDRLDASDNVIPAESSSFDHDGFSRLTSSTDGAGAYSFVYDHNSNILSQTTTYKKADGSPLASLTVAYDYYPDGSRKAMHTPGADYYYFYDLGGRLVGLTGQQGSVGYDYDDDNRIIAQYLPNGVTTSYQYNALGQVTSITNADWSGNTLSAFTNMQYDGSGNRVSMTPQIFDTTAGVPNSYSATYSYDHLDRLTGESSTWTGINRTFGYDDAGNLQIPSLSFNANNQITSSNTSQFSYDNEGNPTVYRGDAISYDADDNLATYGSQFAAGYRADGLRAWKQGPNGRIYFVYDGDKLVAEVDEQGNGVASTWGATGLIGRGSAVYLYDPQGSAIQMLDGTSGVVLDSRRYSAYGVPQQAIPTDDPIGFGGQYGYYTDAETALILCMHRYYDPPTGRWLTRDPIGYKGGINLYAYCENNPTNSVDATGFNSTQLLIQNLVEPTSVINILAEQGPGVVASSGVAVTTLTPILTTSGASSSGLVTLLNPGAVIIVGAVAIADLTNYAITGKTSSRGFTGFGAMLGKILFPLNTSSTGKPVLNCFVAGTPIQMADGTTKPIENVRPGDEVISRNPETGETGAKHVTELFANTTAVSLLLVFSDGTSLETTPGHPFFVDKQGFTLADQLRPGMLVSAKAGLPVRILSILRKQHDKKKCLVYNFTVEDYHSYFVGSGSGGGVWVHNNSKDLGDNLTRDGFIKGLNDQAHHIVPETATYRSASQARAILTANNIHIDSSDNGVWLPNTSRDHSPGMTPHHGGRGRFAFTVHSNAYYDAVLRELQNAAPGQHRNVLRSIRTRLIQGTFR